MTLAARKPTDLGIVDLAKIAQAGGCGSGYGAPMATVPAARRTARATYEGHGIIVGRIEHEWRLFRGMRDDFAFVVPERGTWEFLYRGTTYRQHPGLLQLKQPGELVRDLRREGAASYEVVVFSPAVLESVRQANNATHAMVFECPQLPVDDPRARTLLTLHNLTRNEERNLSPDDPLALQTAVAEAANALVTLSARRHGALGQEGRTIRKAKAYLRERLSERIQLDDLADHVRMDKFHLVRAFRSQVGVPPYTFLTHARVHRARELLRAGLRVSEAATAVGFCDQSQLHRHFVRLVGITPGRYAAAAHNAPAALSIGAQLPALSRRA